MHGVIIRAVGENNALWGLDAIVNRYSAVFWAVGVGYMTTAGDDAAERSWPQQRESKASYRAKKGAATTPEA